MARESTLQSLHEFLAQHAQVIDWAHAEARCTKWGLPRERFAEALRHSAEKRFKNQSASDAEVAAYLRSLHVEDLALARACGDGIPAAWEFFMARFRADLHGAARAILRTSGTGDAARAEDLADSLYAELYGIKSSGSAERKSLFEYFHGRSKLSTWLRAILAQRHVDLLRCGQRTVPLDTEEESGRGGVSSALARRVDAAPSDPNREEYISRLADALVMALGALAPRERMLLACYYIDRLTLAEIGRNFREHESTISRQLERIRQHLRERVTAILLCGAPANDGVAARAGMSAAQVELTFEYALTDWPFDLERALSNAGDTASPIEE